MNQCQHPEKLKDKPENCTSEQIKECHGDTKVHDCGCADVSGKGKTR